MKFTILGCGSSMGVPRSDGFFGNCDPRNNKNYRTRCSALLQTKTENIFHGQNESIYHASFFDVSGIRIGTEVKLAGVSIGKVLGISLDTQTYSAKVSVVIDSQITTVFLRVR